ncbi:hypothetical protein QE177_10880 [Arsenophonus sp. aPb]|uniref:hypothetical protein n=1 Tax=Arsenophonus sp. aPb TaxID=3041619 RepID=UPI002468C85D|nr:hypothetical protein [Arsenophonus sp. aPb]WGL97703.1 hypothetical protein QE177_10880 [Arsenophonus sp. aPb]
MTGLLKILAIIISIFNINCGYATTDILNDNIKGTDINTNIGLNPPFEKIFTNIIDATIEIKNNVPQLSN